MEIPTVQVSGVAVSESREPGYFCVSVWSRVTTSATMETVMYDRLTWDEVLDVIGAELDNRRPGFQHVDGGWQPSLWSTVS